MTISRISLIAALLAALTCISNGYANTALLQSAPATRPNEPDTLQAFFSWWRGKRDFPEGMLESLNELSNSGQPDAQFLYSRAILRGSNSGDAKTVELSEELLRRAARSSSEAQILLSRRKIFDRNAGPKDVKEEVIRLTNILRSRQNSDAALVLAEIASIGAAGVKADEVKADKMYVLSRRLGNDRSVVARALHKKRWDDIEESDRLFEEAVLLGDAQALTVTGERMVQSREQSTRAEGIRRLQRAAARGYSPAARLLETLSSPEQGAQ